ncbi:hypothetical protein R7D97_25540 [Vibrio sp. Vb5031]|nr:MULTISPECIES: hypothetical protein [Vibrio]ANS55795.1 hypothetical protein [Vibrio parahaemolyticus]EJL6492325.1 hypothetical protein [Vibrio cholerae]EJL6644135.1 hypothetical protein [Vibrio cholerae]MBL4243706.1 hypothetical protein [Vibrio fluvialis]MBL4252461.1 hypothetical protein [Vibrio fluvialis]
MQIIVTGNGRFQPLAVTESVLNALLEKGITVPIVEIADDADNLFLSPSAGGDLIHEEYLQIQRDESYFTDSPVFFVEIFERQHSGGDIGLEELLEFLPSESEQFISQITAAYITHRGLCLS